MPIRPSQTPEDAAARWAEVRAQVGSRVRTLRTAAGLTQEALALESGLSRNQLIELEHGRRGLLFERLPDLAAVLDCEVADFFRDG
ncbi:helix-turn-helix protein [Ornithinicoccus hortensis]|uniref:Helix-turn-helix protein n=1 Tax=Ornithinicoccus hortensis TaxID=82346 RepID=A0A542YRM1_9MICO|nr:helix-turn-helix protein [Ornithinicoccus hortensis]